MLIPYSTERERKDFPVMTVILLMLQLACFIPNFFPAQIDVFYQEFGFIPVAPSVIGAVTYCFLHDGFFHLIGNALYFWVFGSHVEDAVGSVWFLLLYFVFSFSALVSHVALTAAASPGGLAMPLVGASGAISGLLGMYSVRFWRAKVKIAYFFFAGIRPFWGSFAMRGVIVLGIWFGMQVVSVIFEEGSSVAYFAHIGPFIFGAGLGLFLSLHEHGTQENLLYEAKEFADTGKAKSAANSLQDVLRREPDNTEALLAMAKVCMDNPKYGDAAQYTRQCLTQLIKQGKNDEAASLYLQSLGLEIPFSVAELFKLAQALESMNNFLAVISVYDKILKRADAADEDSEPALFHQCRITMEKLRDGNAASQKLNLFLERFPNSVFAPQAREMIARAKPLSGETQ